MRRRHVRAGLRGVSENLRLCRTGSDVGCCDKSPHRGATAHAPEGWGRRRLGDVFVDLEARRTPQCGPTPRDS